jgi:hypothetical protein
MTRLPQPKRRKLGSVQQELPEFFSKITSVSKTTKENDTTSNIKNRDYNIEKDESEEFASGTLNELLII